MDTSPTRSWDTTPRPLRAVNPTCIVSHNLAPVSGKRAIEIVQEFLKGELPPEDYVGLFVLDDRDQCVDLWRSLGLATFQVNYGAF